MAPTSEGEMSVSEHILSEVNCKKLQIDKGAAFRVKMSPVTIYGLFPLLLIPQRHT
jgi:hypothetical protein